RCGTSRRTSASTPWWRPACRALFRGPRRTEIARPRRKLREARSPFRSGRGEPLRLANVFRRVDVEKRVERLDRPFGDGKRISRAPFADLVRTFLGEGVS